MKYIVTLQNKTYEVEVEHGEAMILDEYEAKAPVAPAVAANAAALASAAPDKNVLEPAKAIGPGTQVVAPLPGGVISIDVKVGDTVAEGDVVAVIEAMKMSVEVNAPSAGTVREIHATVGKAVDTGEVMMVI